MEIDLGNSHIATLHDLIDLEKWGEAVEYYRHIPDAAAKANAAVNMYYAIALVRIGRVKSGISILHAINDDITREIPLLLRHVVKPLINKTHQILS